MFDVKKPTSLCNTPTRTKQNMHKTRCRCTLLSPDIRYVRYQTRAQVSKDVKMLLLPLKPKSDVVPAEPTQRDEAVACASFDERDALQLPYQFDDRYRVADVPPPLRHD
ncbi:hypothetical protein BC938DRAFT_475211 [Jimgerdemannia flammicorona]|uniref:Uncharacterized protein n=1 Tax=Jimgerdemannia flammicorona TaxID=994334 RepID=A0A433PYM9_9FUNG|nr:hypothetical protein BC938DRAFT_475211 [Jimgerdemannia flammicorona]